jgi:hypothetical protein
MLHLLTPCVCGGSFDRPNAECGHCQLVQTCCDLLRLAFERQTRRVHEYDVVRDLAESYDLPPADVRRIVGPDTETEESPCP